MELLFTIIGRLWGFIIAFIRRIKTTKTSVLPLSMKVCRHFKSASWMGRNKNEPTVWEVQKEEFLRHPSLRSKKGRQQNRMKAKVNRYQSDPSACTPADVWGTSPFLSAQTLSRPSLPSVVTSDSVLVPTVAASQYSLDVLTAPAKEGKAIDPNTATSAPAVVESSRISSESMASVIQWSNLSVVSGVCDLLFSGSRWARYGSPTSSVESNVSYFTSTPTKKVAHRSAGYNVVKFGMPDGSLRTLRLPDEQLDLLPYPDVFDLDLYYGDTSQRLSDPIGCTSSMNLCSINNDTNIVKFAEYPPCLGSSSVVNSLPSNSETSDNSPVKSSKQVAFVLKAPDIGLDLLGAKRYRDHYRHPAYSVSPTSTPTPNPKGASIRSAPFTSREGSTFVPPLSDAINKALYELSNPATRPTAKGILPLNIRSDNVRSLNVPMRAKASPVSPSGSYRPLASPDVLGYSDVSSEALKTSLEEMGNMFSNSFSTDNSYSMEVL